MYSVKEIFYTLQGEGARAGRPAIFCRFSGCNLWNGLENGREKAVCQFCDTDFIGTDGSLGGKFHKSEDLSNLINSLWPVGKGFKYVVLTGGEPLLQVDNQLIEALHLNNFEIAVETNGTIQAPNGIDWLCVSPKAGSEWVQKKGEELKLVYPQPLLTPDMVENANFDNFYIQPMDGPNQNINLKKSIAYCQDNPRWQLSIQTHKIIDIK